MGFIKSIFGIIGGVFKAILGVFGIGKKSEFYMEIEEDSAAAPAPAAPAPAVAKTVSAPVATSPAAAPAPAAKPAASVPSFAANYLTGPTMPRRRRPGPSLSPFMDMAKQVTAR